MKEKIITGILILMAATAATAGLPPGVCPTNYAGLNAEEIAALCAADEREGGISDNGGNGTIFNNAAQQCYDASRITGCMANPK